jgi:hypothetical protein
MECDAIISNDGNVRLTDIELTGDAVNCVLASLSPGAYEACTLRKALTRQQQEAIVKQHHGGASMAQTLIDVVQLSFPATAMPLGLVQSLEAPVTSAADAHLSPVQVVNMPVLHGAVQLAMPVSGCTAPDQAGASTATT